MTATAITSLGEVTEVPEKAKRWTYTFEYKVQIVKQAEASKPGDVGALLRHEGLCSSHLTTWRQAWDRGELSPGSKSKKSGPRAVPVDARDKKIADLSTPPRGGRRQLLLPANVNCVMPGGSDGPIG